MFGVGFGGSYSIGEHICFTLGRQGTAAGPQAARGAHSLIKRGVYVYIYIYICIERERERKRERERDVHVCIYTYMCYVFMCVYTYTYI